MSKRFAFTPPTRVLVMSVFALSVLAATAGTGYAEDSWSMSSLNPFRKASTDKRARASFSDNSASSKKSSWLSPSRPSSTSSFGPRKKEPSTLEKMSSGTKAFFGKTKDVLMPWSKSPQKTASSRSRQTTKKSYFSSWFPAKTEKKESKTVKDFLAQDRPGY